jgi:hypothetical protein
MRPFFFALAAIFPASCDIARRAEGFQRAGSGDLDLFPHETEQFRLQTGRSAAGPNCSEAIAPSKTASN